MRCKRNTAGVRVIWTIRGVSEVFPSKRDEPIAAGQVEAENTHPKQEAQSPQPQPETEPARTPIAEVPAQPDVS